MENKTSKEQQEIEKEIEIARFEKFFRLKKLVDQYPGPNELAENAIKDIDN